MVFDSDTDLNPLGHSPLLKIKIDGYLTFPF